MSKEKNANETELEGLPTAETQDEQLIRNLFLYPTVKEAAEKAGFTGSMLQSGVYVKIKRRAFQDKIREYAIAHNVMSLPKIMMIEDKVIEHLLKKPLDSAKHTRMLAEKKRIAGILGEDTPKPQSVVTINYAELRMIHSDLMPDHSKKDVEEAEIIDK